MNVLLTDAEMMNIIFLAIQQYSKAKNTIGSDIIRMCLDKIRQKDVKDTQDICDTVLECFDLYNAFVKEKNMDLPLMHEDFYDMIVMLINSIIIGEMSNGIKK